MPQINYRANLSAAIFPLSLSQAGRSVIIPGPDNTYDRRVDPEGEQKNAGIPQAIYLENVIPTADGYQSVGYQATNSLPATNYSRIDQLPALRFDQIYKITVAFKSPTTFKSSNIDGLGTWTDVIFSGTAAYPSSGRITSAVVRGTCYVFIRGVSNQIYTAAHDGTSLTLTNVTGSLSGITIADVVEICGSYNYLIAVEDTGRILWSSTTTPLDFTASLVTGAGSATPNNALNRINTIEATPKGFYLVTSAGILHGTYTGNSRYPWKFMPVEGTSDTLSLASDGGTSETAYTLETAGTLKAVSSTDSGIIAPELSDYLRRFESVDSYDTVLKEFTSTTAVTATPPKLYLFFARYICLSCQSTVNNKYDAIIVFDITLRRYGRLKISHTHLVTYNSGSTVLNAGKIGVINAVSGECYLVDFNVASATATHEGVLVLGKFQYVRSRFLALDEIGIEGDLESVDVNVLPSIDGKNFDSAVVPSLVSTSDTYNQYSCRAEAKNHSIVISGAFSISTVELTFHPGASR